MKTALLLSGGGPKGAIQAGALRVVLKRFRPDCIIGTSVGSLNGAVIADGGDAAGNAERLVSLWHKFDRRTFFPPNIEFFSRHNAPKSLFSNKGLYESIGSCISAKRFEELSIPLFVNCTNMYTGRSEYFSTGKILDPLVASCSAAPAYPPVQMRGIPYIDGAFGSVLGAEKAISLGIKKAVIISLEHYTTFRPKKNSLGEYADRILAIARRQDVENSLELLRLNKVRVVEISPEPPTYELLPLHVGDVGALIRLGERKAKSVLGKDKI